LAKRQAKKRTSKRAATASTYTTINRVGVDPSDDFDATAALEVEDIRYALHEVEFVRRLIDGGLGMGDYPLYQPKKGDDANSEDDKGDTKTSSGAGGDRSKEGEGAEEGADTEAEANEGHNAPIKYVPGGGLAGAQPGDAKRIKIFRDRFKSSEGIFPTSRGGPVTGTKANAPDPKAWEAERAEELAEEGGEEYGGDRSRRGLGALGGHGGSISKGTVPTTSDSGESGAISASQGTGEGAGSSGWPVRPGGKDGPPKKSRRNTRVGGRSVQPIDVLQTPKEGLP